VQLTAAAVAVLAGVRLSTGAIYLIAAVPLVIATMIASVIWRSAKRERVSRALRSRLESPNPQTRRDALDKVTDEMLSEHSVMMCELLARESDPDVLDALAAAVARSKWEPTEDATLLQLRRWVAGGQVRTTSSSGGAAPTPMIAVPSSAVGQTAPRTAAAPAVPIDAAGTGPALVGVPMAVAAPGASTNGRESGSGEPDLVDKVREVLGEGVERVELVSIDGELLTSWSAGQLAGSETPPPSDEA
jgi:hypothetical protein